MIKDIHLKNVATFCSDEGTKIEGLSNVNFFYGTNGTGKTTISRVINCCDDFHSCNLCWRGNQIETYVYNEEFVQDNFLQSDIQGVFTLGKEAKQTEEKIAEKQKEIEGYKTSLETLNKTLENKQHEKANSNADFTNYCWNLKIKFESEKYGFSEAFRGVRNSMENFKIKLLSFLENESIDLESEDFLIRKCGTVFSNNPQKLPAINQIDSSSIKSVEGNEILFTKIIGKEDVNISTLITKLGNSDWVRMGMSYQNDSDDVCPFCQQCTKEIQLKKQLEEYFDDTFSGQMEMLDETKRNYIAYTDTLVKEIENILSVENHFIDKETLLDKLNNIKSLKELNERIIDEKIEKPSALFELTSILNYIDEINEVVIEAQKKTAEHNNTVENITSEKEELCTQIWKYVSGEAKNEYDALFSKQEIIQKGIEGIEKSMTEKNNKIREATRKLQELEGNITSIKPTINIINKMLQEFGFSNFLLAESEKPGFYKVVREGGEDAKKTLSEGEKTFLTFLYFYQRLKGSNVTSGTTNEKIVVFDDPISSLDSNILFIVSSMIRQLIEEAKSSVGNIKQIFVFTHNVYFHKEVSFKYEGNAITHWLLKKRGKVSTVEYCDKNPVQSSYQLLWDEIKSSNSLSIRNTMRRILETYFQHYGDTKIGDLYKEFQGDKQLVCKALISWIHDGSHNIIDDLFINYGDELVVQYKEVFKDIFDKKGQIAHYNMMMKIEHVE